MPDGYSQIFVLYVFGPSGFWTMAPLRYAAKFDPFLSLDFLRPRPWRIPRKGRDQILPSGNLGGSGDNDGDGLTDEPQGKREGEDWEGTAWQKKGRME